MKKKIKGFFKWLFIILAAILILMTSWNQILCAIERSQAKEKFSGNCVTVEGKNMEVNILGEENDTAIVFLPGLGGVSSLLEYKPFLTDLSENYKVIVLEPFGYGLSDGTNEDRTITNVVDELHAAVQELGVDEYYLMAHSWGGAYSLVWANKFTDEVLGFVGIDPSVPGQGEIKMGIMDLTVLQEASCVLNKITSFIGINRLNLITSGGVNFTDSCYTPEDSDLYSYLFLNRAFNSTIMDECFRISETYGIIDGMKFPDSVPVLNLVSTQNSQQFESWYPLHEETASNNPATRNTLIEGSHNLTNDNPEALLREINDWIE